MGNIAMHSGGSVDDTDNHTNSSSINEQQQQQQQQQEEAVESLSIWNQHSPRVYLCVVLCFPCPDAQRAAAARHLDASLQRLAEARPLFAARLQADDAAAAAASAAAAAGRVSLRRSPGRRIPFSVVEGHEWEGCDYADLKERGFPPSLFVHPDYAIPGGGEALSPGSEPLPVSRVQARFVRGGLLLSVILHHALMDGQSLQVFLEALAAQTRREALAPDLPSDQSYPLARSRRCRRASLGVVAGTATAAAAAAAAAAAGKQRRSGNPNPHHTHHRGSAGESPDAAYERLAAKCPEYTILGDRTGPTQPRFAAHGTPMAAIARTGKIFVFSNPRLAELRELFAREHPAAVAPPSKYTILAALTWAHVTKARAGPGEEEVAEDGGRHKEEEHKSKKQKHHHHHHHHHHHEPPEDQQNLRPRTPPPTPSSKTSKPPMSQLWNSVSFRSRAFHEASRNYLGNAALPALTRSPPADLLAACADPRRLVRSVVPLVRQTIDAVDQAWVHRRLAMLATAPDPRCVGVDYDPRCATALAFNTWRHFGADAEWDILGQGDDDGATAATPIKPDAIRRAHGAWNLGTALILPARADADQQELFLSLRVEDMDRLCRDPGWLRWVDRIIE